MTADGVSESAGREGGHELDAPPWSRVEGTLMSTARAVRRAYDRCLADVGVNLTEASILAHLGDGGSLTQVQLARRIGTSRARVGVHIDALQCKGAVERRAHPSDRRVWMVCLTPVGEELWARTIDVDRDVRGYLRAGTTAAEREQLDNLLARIQRNVEAIPRESSAERRAPA
ncbi:MAG: MarR family transcriptional regulator [Acidimicrobiia bacterium]|nr:MarR family transcriptional regulator [Acidimicrobiia bacterium]